MSVPSREPADLDHPTMNIAEVAFCLPADVQSVTDPASGEVLITRPGSRRPPQLLSDDAWALLQQFREPVTINQAVIAHCAELGRDPLATLEEAFAVLVGLADSELLVPEGHSAAPLEPRLASGQQIGPARLTTPIRVLRDSELWWALLGEPATAEAQTCVVKVVDDPAMGPELFGREVAALQRLAGGPVPDLLWHRPAATGGTLVLGLAEGDPVDLAALDEHGRRPRETALRLVLAVLDAYAEVHERGVLHGDVHPGNVLATPDGQVRLLDFGLAAISGGDLGPPPRTGGGEHLDPRVAAALLDDSPPPDLDLPAELHALAALGYRVLCGHPHLDLALERREALRLITTAPPLPFSDWGRPAWPAVEAVLGRALSPDPDERPRSVGEFRDQLAASVEVMEATTASKDFFTHYAQALLDRDADTIAGLYALPALIAFPGQSIPVSDTSQTRDFFAASFGQYEGITEAEPQITVVAHAPHSIWADVTWSYDGQPRERFIYQLLDGPQGWQIGVLTPLDL